VVQPDTAWPGVSVGTLLGLAGHDGPFALAHCDGGCTTNLPVADLTVGKAWVAYAYDGQPLAPEHGGPARLLVPHLYFWKSAKWVRSLELRDTNEPGFWRTTATTSTETHGGNSATRAADLAGSPGSAR
jgi:DMSO/TMAO reductase YedYZ molybdopterin-dependent catalytic subunit